MQERIDGITSHLAFELRTIPGIELGAYQAYVESSVNNMLQVSVLYVHAMDAGARVVGGTLLSNFSSAHHPLPVWPSWPSRCDMNDNYFEQTFLCSLNTG